MAETADRTFQMRVTDSFLRSVDDWRRDRPELPPRAEAIRQLVEQGMRTRSEEGEGDWLLMPPDVRAAFETWHRENHSLGRAEAVALLLRRAMNPPPPPPPPPPLLPPPAAEDAAALVTFAPDLEALMEIYRKAQRVKPDRLELIRQLLVVFDDDLEFDIAAYMLDRELQGGRKRAIEALVRAGLTEYDDVERPLPALPESERSGTRP